jgi:hypothetical protein
MDPSCHPRHGLPTAVRRCDAAPPLQPLARWLRLGPSVNALSRFELSMLAVFLLPLALGFFLVAFA